MSAGALRPIEWADGGVRLLDQRLLPAREQWLTCASVDAVAEAIRNMTVRGAPAIGITAAYGMALAAKRGEDLGAARRTLAATRPTAVNLFWALEQCARSPRQDAGGLLELARSLHDADVTTNRTLGALGARRLESGMGVVTHCNAGALATGGYGTALGVLFAAAEQGKQLHVYVEETRPRLQGARLTAWELARAGIPHTLVCDGMTASLMARGKIQAAVVGADRIAANGDTANKIGTYSLAVVARHHGVPFYVAAPKSTFDLALPDGRGIPIEERSPSEVFDWGGERTCPEATPVYNPAFDVTPAALIRALFTEAGEIESPTAAAVARVVGER
jgi:methylthioribose-1-phosphate isomerase